IYSISSSEAIEIVDIYRTQISLQSIEYVGQGYGLVLGLDSIHVCIELRHAVLKCRVGGVRVELVLLPRLVQNLRRDPREFVIAMRTPILQEQLEPAGGAQALNRGRRHGEYHGILN